MADWFPSAAERRAWLDRQDQRLGNALSYYLGPAAAPVNALANVAAAVSPGADLMDAVRYGGDLMRSDNALSAAQNLGMVGAAALGMALPGRASTVDDATDTVLRLLREGRGAEVTDEMMAAADPKRLFDEYDLPMDEASRMARAREMGFDGTPMFHGTGSDFDQFRPQSYLTSDPLLAGDYADASGRNPTVYGAVARADNPLVVDRAQDGTSQSSLKRRAAENGNDAIVLENADDSIWNAPQRAPSRVSIAFDPRNIRSRFARFDPRLAHLRNLSAGVAGGYLGANALAGYGEEE